MSMNENISNPQVIDDLFYKKANLFIKEISCESDTSFKIHDGSKNVILSCPHAVAHVREGIIRSFEPETGVLAKLLNEYESYPIIIKTKNENDDANYDEKSLYKDALINYIKEKNIKGLLDLHLLSSNRVESINIGTGKNKNFNNELLIDQIQRIFDSYDLGVISIDHPFSASRPTTISSYIHSQCMIPTLQIEINSSLVFPKTGEDYKNSRLHEVYLALKEVLSFLVKTL